MSRRAICERSLPQGTVRSWHRVRKCFGTRKNVMIRTETVPLTGCGQLCKLRREESVEDRIVKLNEFAKVSGMALVLFGVVVRELFLTQDVVRGY